MLPYGQFWLTGASSPLFGLELLLKFEDCGGLGESHGKCNIKVSFFRVGEKDASVSSPSLTSPSGYKDCCGVDLQKKKSPL